MELTDTNQPCGLSISFSYQQPLSTLYYSIIEFLRLEDSCRCHVPQGRRLSLLSSVFQVYGGHSEEDPPVPIPNTEVKLFSADGTARETVWESRSPPFLYTTAKAPVASRDRGFCGSTTLLLTSAEVQLVFLESLVYCHILCYIDRVAATKFPTREGVDPFFVLTDTSFSEVRLWRIKKPVTASGG
jgi:hypothetical protein